MFIEGPVQGQTALLRFLINRTAAMPDDVRDKLIQLAMPDTAPSGVVASIEAVELIYARKDDLPPALLGLAADLADMSTRLDFHDYRSTGRGPGISAALRQIDGVEPAAAPPPAQAPEPKAQYVAPEQAAPATAEA